MDLYFAPLSCSLATRISLYEAGLAARFHQVELATKRVQDGRDYRDINPKGQVPALITDDGQTLTEGPAILQYVADLAPDGALAPPAGTDARHQLRQWLNYIATEIHKGVFYLLFNPAAPPAAKSFARELLPSRYDFLAAHLQERDYLLDAFSVADAYLVTTFGWAAAAGFDLAPWPALGRYAGGLRARPAVAKAIGEEMALVGRA